MKSMQSKQNILSTESTIITIPKTVTFYCFLRKIRISAFKQSIDIIIVQIINWTFSYLELVRQKAVNFDLLRENANLKSQLESLQNTVSGLKLNTRNDKTEEKTLEKANDELYAIEQKAQEDNQIDMKLEQTNQELMKAKDENFHLKAEVTKCR